MFVMKEFLPAHAFEQATGMTGIAFNYVLPEELQQEHQKDGNSFFSLCRVWDESAQSRIFGLVDKVIALNPGSGLDRIALDRTRPQAVQDFLHGVLSGFNADDISHYLSLYGHLTTGNSAESFQKIPGYEDRIRQGALENRIGHQLGWLASSETLDTVKRQAGLGEWTPTRRELREAERKLFTIPIPTGMGGVRTVLPNGDSSAEHEMLRLLEHYKG